MEAKRKLLIIYPYEWLAYAPTVLRLRNALLCDFDVTIVAYDGGSFCAERIELPGVEYISLPRLLRRIAQRLCERFPRLEKRWHFFHIARALHLWFVLRSRHFDEVLGSDYSGTWVAQKVFRGGGTRVHFLSLEIYDSDVFARRLNLKRVASAVVQTEDRFEWLFPGFKPHVFYIQNAPAFREHPSAPPTVVEEKRDLVYCGTALPRFGIFPILDFLRAYPGFRLTIQGLTNSYSEELLQPYSDLVAQGRLILNQDYLGPEELLVWMARFEVGFCFYDFEYITEDQFNYRTVPSGKLFNYHAAGVPVVGSDIPGLRSVRDFGAGVLIEDLSPQSIAIAVGQITANLENYRRNAFRAAAHFDFDRAVEPFRRFLLRNDGRESL